MRTALAGDGCRCRPARAALGTAGRIVGWQSLVPRVVMKKLRVLGRRAEPVAELAVVGQRAAGARVQQHLSRLAELRIADGQHPAFRVEVVAVQAERFADPQPGAGQQSDQRLELAARSGGRNRARRRHQREDLLVAVEVRGGAVLARREQLDRRDLARRVKRVQVAREGADGSQPLREIVAAAARGQPGPRSAVSVVTVRSPVASANATNSASSCPSPTSLNPTARRSARYSSTCSARALMPLLPATADDRSEREPVDLGVDRGDVPAAVAQHLADLRQAPAGAEHLGRGGVPETVSADHRQPRPLAGVRARSPRPHRTRDRPCGARTLREHKHALAARTPASQPARQRLADISGQRQTLLAAALPADQQLARAPVDIRQPQRGDLAGTQPQPRQHRDDREIPPPDPRAPVTARNSRASDLASSALTSPPAANSRPTAPLPRDPGSVSPSTCKKRNSTRSRVTMHFAEPTLQRRDSPARTRSPPRRPTAPAPASASSRSPATTRTRARRRHSSAPSTATTPAAQADTPSTARPAPRPASPASPPTGAGATPTPRKILKQRTQCARTDSRRERLEARRSRREPLHTRHRQIAGTQTTLRQPATHIRQQPQLIGGRPGRYPRRSRLPHQTPPRTPPTAPQLGPALDCSSPLSLLA